MNRPAADPVARTPAPAVSVQTCGEVPTDVVPYARSRIGSLVRCSRDPILYARVKLTQVGDPTLPRPAIAQANLNVNGRQLRAHVAAGSMRRAVDLLQARLQERRDLLARYWEAQRGGAPRAADAPGGWPPGDEPTHRPDYRPRPVGRRAIVRHKSFTLPRETPDEAAFHMEAMDYDFHLFIDAETGRDSVIHRDGAGYGLATTDPPVGHTGPVAVSLTISGARTPRLDVSGAIERLEIIGRTFVFFVDSGTGRGNVLYHRYDGHYGLITPAV